MATLNTAAAEANRDASLAGQATRYEGATLVIYDGAVPANAGAALSGNTVLATFTLPAFSGPAAGVITAGAITGVTITGTGSQTASFARILDGGEVVQLTLGESAAEVIVDSVTFIAGNTANVSSLTIAQAA